MNHKTTIRLSALLLALAACVGIPSKKDQRPSPHKPLISAEPMLPVTAVHPTQMPAAEQQTSERITLRAPEPISPERAAFLAALNPREPHPKIDPVLPYRGEDFRIVVKFKDEVKARPDADGKLSVVGEKLPEALATIADTQEIEFTSYFAGIEDKMAELEERAARNSGNSQADFRGITAVKVDDSAASLELATELNGLDIVEYAYVEALDVRAPLPSDIAPDTPDLTQHQTWRLTDPGHSVDYSVASNAKGQGVRISVIEGAYRAGHEDLVGADLVNGLEEEFGDVPQVPTDYSSNVDVVSPINGITSRDHGTSTLGIICAQDNGYGMTGMAPEARVQFYSNDTINPMFTTAFNIGLAAQDSRAGDIILLEVQSDLNLGAENFGPAELEAGVWDATKLVVDAGIVVVAAAGNGGVDLDSPAAEFYMNRGDSGAIIVGAGTANGTHNRLPFSSYGSRLNVHAWGEAVATTGDGDFNIAGDLDQGYKDDYGGTSSASALVAAACTSVQSLAIASEGAPWTPSSMRIVLRDEGNTQGDWATNGRIGRALDLQKIIDERFSANPKFVVDSFQWTEDFAGSDLPNRLDGWRILAEPSSGRVRNTNNALRLDSISQFDIYPTLATATLHVRLAGKEDILLEFDHRNYGDVYQGGAPDETETFTGTADLDGVFISADGLTWHRLRTPHFDWSDSVTRHYRISLDDAIEQAGIEYNNDFRIRFQCFTAGRYGLFEQRGRSFDNVSVHVGEAGSVGFGANSTLISIPEGQSQTLALLRSGGGDGLVSVKAYALDGYAAREGVDFFEVQTNHYFQDGQFSNSITIHTIQDDLPEPTELIAIQLFEPGNGGKLGQFRTAIIRILDDDTADEPGVVFHDTNTSSQGVDFDADAPGAVMSAFPIEVPAGGPTAFADMQVRINQLTHERTSDLDIVLEAPDGRRVMLMSDGGQRDFNVDNSGSLFLANLEFTAGATPFPQFGPVESGTYGAADYAPSPDQMLPPIGTFSGGSDLSIFDGMDPRGTWTLYIQDQWSGGGGTLQGGWELLLTDGSAPSGFKPEIKNTYLAGGQIYIQFTNRQFHSYEIQTSNDLTTWTPTLTVVGAGGLKTVNLPATASSAYFRVVEIE